MKIAIGCDHAGFLLKETVINKVTALGHDFIDCGTSSTASVDYPDYAQKVANLVATKQADRGILICGSGVGVCITANKFKDIRACVCHDTYSARQAVEHDALNILCLGARIIGSATCEAIIEQFLSATFLVGSRHEKRISKIQLIESTNFK